MEQTLFKYTKQPLVHKNSGDKSLDYLRGYIEQNRAALLKKLSEHDALLFRGFDVASPADFEQIAKTIDSNLKNDYLVTSPRDQVPGTEFVFTASELANFYPIMQHC